MSTEHRYFTGVSGDTQYRGELFGITNMFKFNKTSGFAKQVFGKTRQTQDGVTTAEYQPIAIKGDTIGGKKV